uniref:Uncharacterized protein n=1 Tax=Physcomitrium patens TaxID=3218 RepID=A0A2K1IV58_PHYPA|nr:hypothetical protein PHYPA_025106 [Physcomitrium patens]
MTTSATTSSSSSRRMFTYMLKIVLCSALIHSFFFLFLLLLISSTSYFFIFLRRVLLFSVCSSPMCYSMLFHPQIVRSTAFEAPSCNSSSSSSTTSVKAQSFLLHRGMASSSKPTPSRQPLKAKIAPLPPPHPTAAAL